MGRTTADGKSRTGGHWDEETVGQADGETWRQTGRGAREREVWSKEDGWVGRQTDRQKRWETEKQTGKKAEGQTGGETGRQTSEGAGRQMRRKRMKTVARKKVRRQGERRVREWDTEGEKTERWETGRQTGEETNRGA